MYSFFVLLMNIGTLLFTLNPDLRKEFRRYETQVKKLVNAKDSILFNQICMDNELLPKYTYIIYMHVNNFYG